MDQMIMDIGKRTKGDIYLGVVGPVRTGKSTFIKRFMELAVIPFINDEDERRRAIDELPQSGQGKMIMTVEPKFVPNVAAKIKADDEFFVNVRLVDCVGYVIDQAKGYRDENGIRLIKTPWFMEAIPFDEAAKIGTQKVIQDHSTIGIVVTTDGSITDIDRDCYVESEEQVIEELTAIGKPFIIVVNTTDPYSFNCESCVSHLKEKYDVPILPMSIADMTGDDIQNILKQSLYEFPVTEVKINVPKWVAVLDKSHWLKQDIDNSLVESLSEIHKLRDVKNVISKLSSFNSIEESKIVDINTSTGSACVDIRIKSGLYNDILKEILGSDMIDKAEFIKLLQQLVMAKNEYDHISSALSMVQHTGYGFALPDLLDIELSEPIVVKQGPRYGIKMISKASTIHMVKVEVENAFEPIIGSKQQAEMFIDYLMKEHSTNPQAIYDCEVFGRKLGDVISESMKMKLGTIPEATCQRIHDILSKIVNKGKTNVIAIVL
ncbi:stage IV sporulation protein A [Beduini massiliensis]|uniref:stage IV sporulation protein A n=1 Tax=Beduini massiliensis TaxID=1585974 RepID=UPI00059AA1CF|nr:stage IV sporulation protein A [Beduini massiliensis]